MILKKYLIPDLMVDHFYNVTPEIVKGMGARALICDIDNTLVTYDDPEPTEAVLEWFSLMNENGIAVSFVSNNEKERVSVFNKKLGFVAYGKAGKPGVKYLSLAARDLGVEKREVILLGDQLLTDCAAAKRFGIKAIIVPPIKDKTSLFFKTKRLIEKPYVAKYKKEHKDDEN